MTQAANRPSPFLMTAFLMAAAALVAVIVSPLLEIASQVVA